jgi:hypothetical protein
MSIQARALLAIVVVLVLAVLLGLAVSVGLLGPIHSTVTHG